MRSRSRKLYKKNIIAKNLPFRTKKYKLSRLLNEQNIGTVKTIHKDIIIKLDDKNNLKNLIVENERDLNFIDEGLIKTIPTRKLIDLFNNFVRNNLDERLYDLKLSDVQDDTNDNRRLTDIILQSELSSFYNEEEINPNFLVKFLNSNIVSSFLLMNIITKNRYYYLFL